MSVG
ncbi:hypothetical protein DGo_CA1805 [Deinococcus gobiensis I-0]|jgi:hypothetical protein